MTLTHDSMTSTTHADGTLTLECQLHFSHEARGRKRMNVGAAPLPRPAARSGRTPKISKLMALAIRFDELLRENSLKDYAEIARLGHVTRARVSQIMNLLHLAPDIQEALLLLPKTMTGRDAIGEHNIRPLTAITLWVEQRRRWARLSE